MNAQTLRPLVVLLPVLLGSQQAAAVDQQMQLRRLLVMLYQERDAPLPGAGIIFKVKWDGPEKEHGAYIVTSRHVITQARNADQLQVRFMDAYGREGHTLHKAEVLLDSMSLGGVDPSSLRGTASEGLAVLKVSLPREELVELPSLLSCAKAKPSCVAHQQSLGNTTEIAVIGFPSGDAWGTALLGNSLHSGSESAGGLLRFQGHTPLGEGYSGGVLATPQWDLLGIILTVEQGAQEIGVVLGADKLIAILKDSERERTAYPEYDGEFFGLVAAGWGLEYVLSTAADNSGVGLNVFDVVAYGGKFVKPGVAMMGGVSVNFPQRIALEVGILEQHGPWDLAIVGGVVGRKGGPAIGFQVGLHRKIYKSLMSDIFVSCNLGADFLTGPTVVPRVWLSFGSSEFIEMSESIELND
jgi:hypothetical protein